MLVPLLIPGNAQDSPATMVVENSQTPHIGTLESPCFCPIQHTANTVTSYTAHLVPMDKTPLAKIEHLKQP